MEPGAVFDGSGQVQRPPYGNLAKEAWSLLFYRPAPPSVEGLPQGEGRPVLVLPAALTNDSATHPLRRRLARCGFRAHPWNLGLNWGPTPALRAGLRRRLLDLHASEGAPIALLDVSMGGLLARDLAHDHPEPVRQVVTVASPLPPAHRDHARADLSRPLAPLRPGGGPRPARPPAPGARHGDLHAP